MNGTLKLREPRLDADVVELRAALAEYVEILLSMTRRLRVAEDQLAQARVSRDGWKSKYIALAPKNDKPQTGPGLEDSKGTE